MKPQAGHSMEKSYEEGCKLLKLMDIDDVPIYHGAKDFIENRADLPTSEGSRFMIEEAIRECEEPLYIALQGTLTNLAVPGQHLWRCEYFFSGNDHQSTAERRNWEMAV